MSELERACERLMVAVECGILTGNEAMAELRILWDAN